MSQDENKIFSAPAGSDRWQARTDWIEGASGRPYQWAIADDGERFHLARRMMGSRKFEVLQVIDAYDLSPVMALLAAAREQRLRG